MSVSWKKTIWNNFRPRASSRTGLWSSKSEGNITDERMAVRVRKYLIFIFVLLVLSTVAFVLHSAKAPYNQNVLEEQDSPQPIQEKPLNDVESDGLNIEEDPKDDDNDIIEFTDDNENNESVAQLHQNVISNQQRGIPPKRILILANFRTGSSFLGDIFQSVPEVFYSFEPLYYLDKNPGTKKTELLRSIFYCQFPGQYLQYINGVIGGGDVNFMKRNKRAWEACQHNQTLCYQPDFIDNLCLNYPIKVIKVVRLRVKELAKLLKEDPNTRDWKIVYLMRDPRGTMASRDKLEWCRPHPVCGNFARLCRDMMEDFKWIDKLMSKDPEHHYILKFEDLSTDVNAEIEKLFDFLEIPVSETVHQFIESHTQDNPESKEYGFSVKKNSKSIPFAWQTQLTDLRISRITDACMPILNKLQYNV